MYKYVNASRPLRGLADDDKRRIRTGKEDTCKVYARSRGSQITVIKRTSSDGMEENACFYFGEGGRGEDTSVGRRGCADSDQIGE